MQKATYKNHDKNDARRLIAMLMLYRGEHVSVVVRALMRPFFRRTLD